MRQPDVALERDRARVADSAGPVRGLAFLALLWIVALGIGTNAARASPSPSCTRFPRPGTTAATGVPALVRAEFGVLARQAGRADHLSPAQLRALPVSGIVKDGIRFLGTVPGSGRVDAVPAEHLLSFPLEPTRCVSPGRRERQAARLPGLRRQYAHHAVCLVIVYRTSTARTCDAAPGTVAPFLYAAGVPGLGLAPDGVAQVLVLYHGHSSIRALVHDNFWKVGLSSLTLKPCGLDWLNPRGLVLRIVAHCTADRDYS